MRVTVVPVVAIARFVAAALARWRRQEQGISSLMVVMSTTALFGSASIAVDAGNLWASRRQVISSSDAAALAAASDYAVGRDGCALASDFVSSNDPDASLLRCERRGGPGTAGYVTVESSTPVDFAFAGLLGFADRTVGAATSAAWGVPSAARGLRPLGLCEDDPNFAAWAADPRGISPVARIPYTSHPTACGGAPGNWGIIDLDNTTPVSASDIQYWVRYGYRESVRPGNVAGDTGAFSNSLDDDLAFVAGERFPIPVFDRLNGQGSNAKFHVIGFVNVELVGWRTTGSQHQRYLDVRFVEMVASGECCDPGGRDFGLRVVRICDVDPTFDSTNCV